MKTEDVEMHEMTEAEWDAWADEQFAQIESEEWGALVMSEDALEL